MRKLHCSLMSPTLLIGRVLLAGDHIPQSHHPRHHLFYLNKKGNCSGRSEVLLSAAK